METSIYSGAVVLLACLGMLPLAMYLRRRGKSAPSRPLAVKLAFAGSLALAAAGVAMALH